MDFASLVYLICAGTSMACAIVLARAYKRSRFRLLLWSCLCFVGFALNNLLLFIDLVIFPASISLALYRGIVALVGLCLIIYGLVMDSN